MSFCLIFVRFNRSTLAILLVLLLGFYPGIAQEYSETIMVEAFGEIPKPIIIEGKKDILISGSKDDRSMGYKTFNNNPYLIEIKNSENVVIKDLTLGYGVKGSGKATIKIEGSKNIKILNCAFQPNSEYAIISDELSTNILIEKCYFDGSHHAAILAKNHSLEVKACEFNENNAIGSIRGDIDEQYKIKDGLATIRWNSFKKKNYKEHKKAMKEFAEVKESTAYRFNCFKIVKKIELGTGNEAKLTAYYEGENNKILDLLEFSTSKRSGYKGGKIYIYNGRPVMCQTRSGKYDFENFWFVYGNFIEKETMMGKEEITKPIDTNSKESRNIEDSWYKIMEHWISLIEHEDESFSFDTPLGIMSIKH